MAASHSRYADGDLLAGIVVYYHISSPFNINMITRRQNDKVSRATAIKERRALSHSRQYFQLLPILLDAVER
jgi:hypothetical protein